MRSAATAHLHPSAPKEVVHPSACVVAQPGRIKRAPDAVPAESSHEVFVAAAQLLETGAKAQRRAVAKLEELLFPNVPKFRDEEGVAPKLIN